MKNSNNSKLFIYDNNITLNMSIDLSCKISGSLFYVWPYLKYIPTTINNVLVNKSTSPASNSIIIKEKTLPC